jgi:hypothetical protein
MYAHPEMRIRDMRAVEISRNLHISPAQFLHSQNLPQYLQLKQSDTKVLSPAQDDSTLDNSTLRDITLDDNTFKINPLSGKLVD